jgi:hypothetical protein
MANKETSKHFDILYNKNANDKELQWQVYVIKNKDASATIYREFGQVNGKLQIVEKIITIPKSKSDCYTQALFDAEVLHNNQMQKKGYKPININNVINDDNDDDNVINAPESNLESYSFLPMLANKYQDKMKYIKFPALCQPKLDGIRFTARSVNNAIELRSRSNLIKPSFDYIRNDIKDLPENITLDGEFYSKSMTFQELNGLCNKKKTFTINESIKYYIFDCYFFDNPDATFAERYEFISEFTKNRKYIELVKCTTVTSHNEIKPLHDKFVKEGYEGLMIRNINSKYKLKDRSNDLLKFKEFFDEEFEIVKCIASDSSTEKDAIMFVLKTKNNDEFTVRPRDTFQNRIEMYKDYLKHPDNYIGKLYTVRYQEKYPDNDVPRFGTGIGIRFDL